MQRIYSHCIGNSIVRYHDGMHLAQVKDILINPDSGKLEALWVKMNNSLGSRKILLSQDIVEWKLNIYVNDLDAFSVPREIVRLQSMIKQNSRIIANRVETKDGEYLGKVVDFSFDAKVMQLSNLYIIKSWLYFFAIERRVIPYQEIIEILPNKIIVKKSTSMVKWKHKKTFALEDFLVSMDPAMNQAKIV